ncbi:RsfA family transcriptional regulator [Bacillus andreraoultii]|uniref:RsfA family transcriptional regulator n=1 Tax=Bacillus andreraoultii TaxID=1499685 RepID=UPI000539AFEC|nr:RsfA family transcriptional regulator [Bacillus andreraoultii]
MTTVRQDAWSKDEDLLLAEVVLRHIREGSTQLKAFEEVGKKLSRTAAACGFRWNSSVRKQYKTGIELAKRQRKELKRKSEEDIVREYIEEEKNEEIRNENLTLEQVMSYLRRMKEQEEYYAASNEQLAKYREECNRLERKLQLAVEENEHLKKEISSLKDDYLSLLSIMEKARKLALKEDEQDLKMKFQMDTNGNLDVVKEK